VSDEATDAWFARQLKRAHPESTDDIDAAMPRVRNAVRCTICAEIYCDTPDLHDVLEAVVAEVARQQKALADHKLDPFLEREDTSDFALVVYRAARQIRTAMELRKEGT
jgi:hypothetical protein